MQHEVYYNQAESYSQSQLLTAVSNQTLNTCCVNLNLTADQTFVSLQEYTHSDKLHLHHSIKTHMYKAPHNVSESQVHGVRDHAEHSRTDIMANQGCAQDLSRRDPRRIDQRPTRCAFCPRHSGSETRPRRMVKTIQCHKIWISSIGKLKHLEMT